MSKIEIVGPKDFLQDVLVLLKKLNILQIEPESAEPVQGEAREEKIRPFLYDQRERTLYERLFLDDLRRKIDELFVFLPKIPVRASYIQPQAIVGTILYAIEKHLKTVKSLHERKSDRKRAMAEFDRFIGFLNTLHSLFLKAGTPPDFEIIGLTIKEKSSVEHIRELVSQMTGGNFRFFTVPAGDGTLAGLITIDKSLADTVSAGLTREHVPETSFPPEFDKLSLSDKIIYLEARILALSMEIEAIDRELEDIGHRWMPLYNRVKEWIDERISLLAATASICQTQMCFYLRGWMPWDDVGRLKAQLEASFGMEVVAEEKHVREEELEHAPIVLTNPPYFKPFELLGRVLPLPAYTSLDATPYIGIFFPIFFGMILGDAGYGVLLVILAIILQRRYKKNKDVSDASKIIFCVVIVHHFVRSTLRRTVR